MSSGRAVCSSASAFVSEVSATHPGQTEVTRIGTGKVVVALHGEHDVSTVPELRRRVAMLTDPASEIVFDLSPASFIDSAVVAVIANVCDRAEKALAASVVVVAPPGSYARRVLDGAGVAWWIPIAEGAPKTVD